MTDDDSQTVSFSVAGVELVHGRGDLIGLAILSLNVSGVAMIPLSGAADSFVFSTTR